ncbi:MAG: ABC transporter permease [Azospirillaceae bacterium]
MTPAALARALMRNRTFVIGAVMVALIVAAALAAPLIAPHDPGQMNLRDKLQGPGAEYLLGTDRFGRDLLSRVLHGARISLAIGFETATAAAVIGIALGAVAGYYGGWFDNLVMRTLDVPLAFPYILLAIVIVATLGPGLTNAMIAIIVVGVPYFARIARGAILTVREQEYVRAAEMAGASDARILLSEILPNMTAPLIVTYTIYIGWMILQAASLSFLGLGAQPPTPEWGAMLSESRQLLQIAPHAAIVPGTAILLVVLAFNMMGDGLRDVLDPRLRGAVA